MVNPDIAIDDTVRPMTDDEYQAWLALPQFIEPEPVEPIDPVAVVKGIAAISALTTTLMAKGILTQGEVVQILPELPV
jgi:hypothetical protein